MFGWHAHQKKAQRPAGAFGTARVPLAVLLAVAGIAGWGSAVLCREESPASGSVSAVPCGSDCSCELSEKVLYESFLPLGALLFLLDTNNMSESEAINFASRTVLSARAYIERKLPTKGLDKVLASFESTALGAPHLDREMAVALELRNGYFDDDRSGIARSLFSEKHRDIRVSLAGHALCSGCGSDGGELDRKYIRMVLVLRAQIANNGNLAAATERELAGFIKDFGEKKHTFPQEIVALRMLISLGGSIFEPGMLVQLVSRTQIPDKSAFVEKNVTKILEPLRKLVLLTTEKSNLEKKNDILEFLRACKEDRSWVHKDLLDEAFRARTLVLEAYLQAECDNIVIEKERAFDRHHERFLENLIERVEALDEQFFGGFLKLNRAIERSYIGLVGSGNRRIKDRLLMAFQWR